MSDQIDEFFGEPISTYTDQQALQDGILVAIPGDGGVGFTSDRPRLAGRGGRRLAELQQNTVIAALLAAYADQYEECLATGQSVHVLIP